MSQNTYKISTFKKKNGTAIKGSDLKPLSSGKVLLITGCTGLGFNYAPHFGVYQIYNYLKLNNISCDMYDRDLELFKKAKIYEKDVIEIWFPQ